MTRMFTLAVAATGTQQLETLYRAGVTLVSVASGSVVRYDAHCAATVFGTGTAFVEAGDHPLLVRNESTTTPAVNIVTFIVPAGTVALRIDSPNPGCPQD